RLERIETDILNNFKRLGVSAASLNGHERLAVMYGMFHMDEKEPLKLILKKCLLTTMQSLRELLIHI
ncbi:MAG: hypothetical protein IKX99_02130, partial [Lachnospiraceae bacterium]|nr:hypothetical protein [Lachnospiraceae bacterium]